MNDNERAKAIQWRNKQIWGWLERNLGKIMDHDPAPKFQTRTGGVLGKRGNKGKPHPETDLHPEFLRYLKTPKAIKLGHEMFEELYQKDRNLYNFIYLRAKGLTYGQIMATGTVSTNLLTGSKEKMLAGKLERSKGGMKMNRRALNFIISLLPENLRNLWGDTPNHEWRPSPGKEENKKWREKGERVTCPMCGGVNPDCVMCRSRHRDWDGTVSWWMNKKYKELTDSGLTWEEPLGKCKDLENG